MIKIWNNKNTIYIWTKYVNIFEKKHQKDFYKRNNFKKYRNYKQRINQLIWNYDVYRIVLFANFYLNIKFSSIIKLQNFVLNFIQNNQIFLVDQKIENH